MRKLRKFITVLVMLSIVYIIVLTGMPPVTVYAGTGEISRLEWLKARDKFTMSCFPVAKYNTPINSQYGYSELNKETDNTENTYTQFEYSLDGIDATITKYNGNESSLSIPDKLDGYNVTGIDCGVFSNRTELRAVIIPDSVKTIGENAFSGCTNLSSVILSKNVTEIGAEAFANCSSLTSIEIPKSLETGGCYGRYGINGAFENCDSLKNVTFEEGTTRVAEFLFVNCTGLETIVIPEGVTVIENWAFYNCENLKNVTLPSTLTLIANNVFHSCISITHITLPGSLTRIGASAFAENKNLKEIVIPDSVTDMGAYALAGCTNLGNVILSKNLTTVGSCAFVNCDSLTSIEIPKSLETGGGYDRYRTYGAFENCDNLKNVTFEEGTTRVAGYLFAKCTGLETIVIPEGVTVIEHDAFYKCNNLKSVTIPSTVTKIGSYAFSDCISIVQIALPESLTEIGIVAFAGNTNLKKIVIPDSVTDMGAYAFRDCTSLLSAKLPSSKNVAAGMFENCTSLASIVLPDTVTSIDDNAFKDCTSLASVTMNNNLTDIGSYAFHNCDALTTVTIPDSVTKIGNYAFSGSDALTTVNFGTGVKEIGSYAFDLCQSLNKVILPYRLTTIANNAFSNCTKLTEVTLNRNVTIIGCDAFSYPDRLTIYGVGGTYAETYANSVGAAFVSQWIPADNVKLNYEKLELKRNDNVMLTFSISPANFTNEVTWKSSDTNVAAVDDSGNVKAVGVGTATISVSAGNASASCTVTVNQTATGLSLNGTSFSLDAGESSVLTVSVFPSNAANKSVVWSSSNEDVAAVDQNGKVTAVSKGTAVITVKTLDGSDIFVTCNVNVTGTAYYCSNVNELESPHNYEVNCTDSWIYTVDGAKELNLTFDATTEMESGSDYLYIYDGQGTQIGGYTGKSLAGQTVKVAGDTVRIKIVSDGSGTAWGFKVSKLQTDKDIAENRNGWVNVDGVNYWYENGVRQGYDPDNSSYRGKEIYDPGTNAWYWLDNVQLGAVAKSKDVYQESLAGEWGDKTNEAGEKIGKWVRYDENGHMIKGWDTNENGTYYFDPVYGTMAKGTVTIDGKTYNFDMATGVLRKDLDDDGKELSDNGWHKVGGVNYWYENGVRQGYDPNNSEYRGKEIYDPSSDAWYWLDNVQDGAVAKNKDVYQESLAGEWGDTTNEAGEKIGKWVRYDENGHMVKGWNTNENGTYYFDPVYGTMAKGEAVIDGETYYFDVNTGVRQ